jgi:hypothetical protein
MVGVVTRLHVRKSGFAFHQGQELFFFFEVQSKSEVNPSAYSFVKKNLGLR